MAFERPQPSVLADALRRHPDLNGDGIDGTVLAPIVTASFERARRLAPATPEAVRSAALGREVRAAVFERALAAPGRRMILEVKAASPSEGLMKGDIDLAAYASVYGRFADAMSVLTEPQYFGGSFERLAALRQMTSLPILAKDFFVAESQVLAAAQAGADAILLMLSVLSDAGYRKLADLAQTLELEILTEADTAEDLERARRLGARVVGVNNRNLRTLEVDRSRVLALAPKAPEGVVLVAESGYRVFRDLNNAASEPRIGAFLCGSALSKAPELSQGVRELLFGRSKVCGITRVEDAVAAVKAGATTVGLILASRSKRRVAFDVAPQLAADIRQACLAAGLPVEVAAVTDAVELTDEAIAAVAAMKADVLQIHGDAAAMTEEFFRTLAARLPGVKAAPVLGLPAQAAEGDAARVAALSEAMQRLHAAGLIDRVVADHAAGGTGEGFDSALLAALKAAPRVVLAGGLCAASAPSALSAARTAGIDLLGLDFNSGVEEAPGVKSARKVSEAFCAFARR